MLSVAGVLVADNRLVNDWDIVLGAADCVSVHAPELAGSVSFHSQMGVLNVYGHVESAASRERVLANLRGVSGVKSIIDETEIRAPVTATVHADDALDEETEGDSNEQDENPTQ